MGNRQGTWIVAFLTLNFLNDDGRMTTAETLDCGRNC